MLPALWGLRLELQGVKLHVRVPLLSPSFKVNRIPKLGHCWKLYWGNEALSEVRSPTERLIFHGEDWAILKSGGWELTGSASGYCGFRGAQWGTEVLWMSTGWQPRPSVCIPRISPVSQQRL